MKNLIYFIIIIFSVHTVNAQRRCKCDSENITNKNNGRGENEIVSTNANFQHPVTTFYRWGKSNWYNPDFNQATNLASLREMLKNAHDVGSEFAFKKVFEDIQAQADKTTGLTYDAKDEPSSFTASRTAKAAGFMVLANFDSTGTALSPAQISTYKNKAIDVIKRLEKDNSNWDDGYYSGNWSSHSSNNYWLAKNLIMLLQAYDYLKAVYPNDADVITCGYLLQCYTRHIFKSSTQILGSLARPDNHGLQAAGAVGLASVVLADHSYNRVGVSWHPDRWQSLAIWTVQRTLYEKESTRGAINGFGEGMHYARHSLENLLPFMLAHTNVRESIDDVEKYGPKGLVSNVWRGKRELPHPLWKDPDLANVVEWYAELMLPDRTQLALDDSYGGLKWDGIITFRGVTDSTNAIHHLPYYRFNQNFTFNYGKWMNYACDIAAAFAEGELSDVPGDHTQKNRVLPSGNIIIRQKLDIEGNLSDREVYFHLNAEQGSAATEYLNRTGGHEHYDAMSFAIYSEGKYNALLPGIRKDGPVNYLFDRETHFIKMPTAQNTITVDKNGSETKKGPKDGKVEIIDADFTGDNTVRIRGFLKKNGKIHFEREVKFWNTSNGGVTFRVTDHFDENDGLDKTTFNYHLNGLGLGSEGTFSADNNSLTYLWNANCPGGTKMTSIFRIKAPGNESVNYNAIVAKSNLNGASDLSELPEHNKLLAKVKNPDDLTFTNWIHIVSCEIPYDTIIPLRAIEGVLQKSTANSFTYNFSGVHTDSLVFDTLFGNTVNDTLTAIVSDLFLDFDFNSPSSDCAIQVPFRRINFDEGELVKINTDIYLESNNSLQDLQWNYHKQFHHIGNVTTTDLNDTITFYLPEVPPTHLSLMEEQTGLNYSYDTTTQKITVYLPDSGTYHFAFGPANPCAVSCFYPPDSLINHFPHTKSSERLGHILDIEQSNSWLDMQEGARMNICSKAILNNLDSLTLSSNISCNEKDAGDSEPGTYATHGYASHYFTSEGSKYRQNYRVGSGAGLSGDGLTGNDLGPDASKRTMIIVENEGALVLKSGSHTVVGNGSTILVKPGGTLKIEDHASLVIGSHDSTGCGYGEVIIMDSAFLCVNPSANLSFYEDELDSVDEHIFYISMNPENGANEGIAPTSNVPRDTVLGDNCTAFCQFKNTFNPPHGIDKHQYGWLNVGKPFAWLEDIGVVCYGQDVIANGLYSLNEGRYRFEICEYDTIAQACIGITDTIPMNDTDNYFGGRLQGSVNLSQLYQEHNHGVGFISGSVYRVNFVILNDCDVSDEVSKIIELPSQLSASISGDTVICGGSGAITVNGSSSTGSFDSLRWEIWRYKPLPELDSATYYANTDTFVSISDTFWLDSTTIDTIVTDTFWFNKADTLDNDSLQYSQYYQQYWDTTIVSSSVGSFNFSDLYAYSGTKYQVVLTLYNKCGLKSDSLTIRTKDGPEVSAGSDQYIPFGTPSSPAPELEGSVGSSVSSHVWSPSSGLSSTSILNPIATPTSTKTYVLSATDADGCTNYDSVLVYVNTIANATRDTTICYNDSVQVGITALAGYTYEWSPANLVSDANIAQPYAYPTNASNLLTLRVYNNGNLVGIDDVVVQRDVVDSVIFGINGSPTFYRGEFDVPYSPVNYTDIVWDFDDGTGTHTGYGSMFTYDFPNVNSVTYNVCASFTNACGLQTKCKDCEVDAIGHVLPSPPMPANIEENAENEQRVDVWPNPFSALTTLSYNLSQNDNAYLEIYDLNGKIIQNIRVSGTQGQMQIDLSQYPDGVYQYSFVNAGTKLSNGKLVLVK